jgi:HEAT repeat protein
MLRRTLAFILVIGCVCVGRSAEPTFADRALSAWIADLDGADVLAREEAVEVLLKMGTAAKPALPKLEQLSKSEFVTLRRRASFALWKIGGQKQPAIDVYTADLKAPIARVRLEAVQRLTQLDVPRETLFPVLVAMLGDSEFAVYGQAMSALQTFGADAVPVVLEALPKAELGQKQRLLGVLQTLGPQAKEAIPALRNMLKESDDRTRMMVINVLWTLDPGRRAENIAALVELGNSKDPNVRHDLVQFGLRTTPRIKELAPAFRAALKDASGQTRVQAAQMLWEMEPGALKEVIAALVAELKSNNPQGWLAAVQTLAQIGPDAKEAIPALVSAIQRPAAGGYAYQMVHALARMGPDAVEPLVKLIKGNDRNVRSQAIASLGQMGPEVLPKLAPLLTSEDAQTRTDAFVAVRLHGSAAKIVLPQLIEGLKRPDASVKHLAVQAIMAIGPEAKDAVPALIAALKDSTFHQYYRSSIPQALGRIGPAAKEALPELTRIMNEGQTPERFRAAEALLAIEPENSEPRKVLLDLLKSPMTFGEATPAQILGVLARHDADPAQVFAALRDAWKSLPNFNARLSLVQVVTNNYPNEKEAVALLRDWLKEDNGNIRQAAAIALSQHGEAGKDAAPVLVELIKGNVRPLGLAPLYMAFAYLGPAARADLPFLTERWKAETQFDHRLALAQALLSIDKEQGKPAKEWLESQLTQNTALAPAVGVVMAKVDPKNAKLLPALMKAARESNTPYQTAQVCEALGLLGPDAKEAAPLLRNVLTSMYLPARTRAAMALWRIEGKADEPVKVLSDIVWRRDPPQGSTYVPSRSYAAASSAALALGEIGPEAKAALPALRTAMNLGDDNLRANCELAIRKIEAKKKAAPKR